jgi:hypothetical protein
VRGIRRLGLLVAVTTAAFALAVGRFESAARDGCAQRAGTDRSYRVELTALTAAGTAGRATGMGDGARDGGASGEMAGPAQKTYRLRVLRDGRAVAGARVCIAAYMRGMSAMAVVGHATETTAGTYVVTVDYPMEGAWTARVVVDERGRPAAATTFDLVAR